jgi:hypothetical protein
MYYRVFYKFINKGISKDLNTHSAHERLFECRGGLVTPFNRSGNTCNRFTEPTLQIETRHRHRNPIQKVAIITETITLKWKIIYKHHIKRRTDEWR